MLTDMKWIISPLPYVDNETQNYLVNLVDAISAKKAISIMTDVSQEENAINKVVYKLYNLSDEQIKIIEA